MIRDEGTTLLLGMDAGMRKWIFKTLLLIVGVAGFLGGLIALGQWARQSERYTISFSDIDCTAPPGLERVAFLDEVQYLAAMPKYLNLLNDDLKQQLADAFRHHPWVAEVSQVELAPPKQVRVTLVYRRPVLAVKLGSSLRAVDAEGILLPREAVTDGLPVYPGKAAPPAGPAGVRWGDPAVESMARACATTIAP
jgi:hypothetical protein